MAKHQGRAERRHVREKATIDHLVDEVFEKKSPDDGHAVHGSTTATGLPVEEQVRKEWDPKAGVMQGGLHARELYHSPNGDRWYLVRDPDFERVFIRHQANLPSGGHTADIEIGAFLNQGGNPEHRELLRLIGTLVEGRPTP
jgi:hypothetical protein